MIPDKKCIFRKTLWENKKKFKVIVNFLNCQRRGKEREWKESLVKRKKQRKGKEGEENGRKGKNRKGKER